MALSIKQNPFLMISSNKKLPAVRGEHFIYGLLKTPFTRSSFAPALSTLWSFLPVALYGSSDTIA